MTPDTLSSVRRLLAEAMRIDVAMIRPESGLVGDLGAKSIDVVEVILALEEELAVDLPDCDITPAPFDLSPDMTVQRLAEVIDSCRK